MHDPEASTGIILEMQDRQRYFEGRMAARVAEEEAMKKVVITRLIQSLSESNLWQNMDLRTIILESKANLQHWETNLQQVPLFIA